MRGKDIILLLASGFFLLGSPASCEEVFDLRAFDADLEIVGGTGFGVIVAAGDINGDGIDDIVTTQEWGNSVYVFFGDTAISGTFDLSTYPASVTINGVTGSCSRYSSPLAWFGDINNDGIEDLLVSSDYGYLGWTFVVYGAVSLPSVVDVHTDPGVVTVFPTWSFCPRAAVGSGDVNGDGFADAIIARGFYTAVDGIVDVFIIFGGDNLPPSIDLESSPPDVYIKHTVSGSFSCPSVCSGDINGDGFDDILFSSHKYADTRGAVFAIFGDETLPSYINLDSTDADFSILGETDAGYFGQGLGTADVNGDGLDDLIASGAAFAGGPQGKVYLFYGDTLLPQMVDLSDTAADVVILRQDETHLGNVTATGDFNQDGFGDMLFGHQKMIVAPTIRAYLVFGGEHLAPEIHLDSTFDGITISGREDDQLGSDVAMGDFNLDGYDDLLLGAASYYSSGKVYVILGSDIVHYGDVNYDKIIDMGDAVFLLNYLFKSGPQPYPKLAGDTNCDEVVDVADVIYLLNYLFKDGSEPGCP